VEHLIEFFDRYVRGPRQALAYDDGLRRWSYSWDQLRATADAVAVQLVEAGFRPGDRLLIWSDSRPEWVAVFWGAVLSGVVVIPVDGAAPPEFVERVARAAGPRGIFAGDGLPIGAAWSPRFTRRMRDVPWVESRAAAAVGAPAAPKAVRAPVVPDTVVEIVFTSGTTGDPKGVVISHRNIIANITPIEREARAYRHYLWPFRPIRFLDLLPLSHMFGQALAMFFPPVVGAATFFMAGHNPDEINARIRRHRITLVIAVPRVLDLLRARLRQQVPSCAAPEPAEHRLPVRWWRYRAAHRLLGWRFCGFVLGGAPLDRDLEDYWRRLGFAVVQGYGLTETAPIVAWNHPFKIEHGTVGRPLEGVEVRLAADGEILVRGPTVTSGYVTTAGGTRSALEDGWFHTGDIGVFDASGHLIIRGRKKDMIATAEGLKVFPEDVERVLEAVPGVREAAVIGRPIDHTEAVHAVLVLQPNADAAAIVREANAKLQAHERVRDVSVWKHGALPRTEPMHKLKRFEIRRWVEAGAPERARAETVPADEVERLLARFAKGRVTTPDTTLDDLGLTSLDRVELVMALEEQARVSLSEAALGQARTLGDLRRLTEQAAAAAPKWSSFPSWNRALISRAIRSFSQLTWILPLAGIYVRLRVEGREHLRDVSGPVIFAGNHQSHFDTPAILKALPGTWRRTIAVAMWKEYFDAHFFPAQHSLSERWRTSALYYLIALLFNAFPLPVAEPGARETIRYIGDLVSDGASILIFPEGQRTERGEIRAFEPGVGLLASRLRLPVVPIRLEGLDRVLHHTWRWPRRGTVTVRFGAPLALAGDDYPALARRVRDAIVALGPAPPGEAERAAEARPSSKIA